MSEPGPFLISSHSFYFHLVTELHTVDLNYLLCGFFFIDMIKYSLYTVQSRLYSEFTFKFVDYTIYEYLLQLLFHTNLSSSTYLVTKDFRCRKF